MNPICGLTAGRHQWDAPQGQRRHRVRRSDQAQREHDHDSAGPPEDHHHLERELPQFVLINYLSSSRAAPRVRGDVSRSSICAHDSSASKALETLLAGSARAGLARSVSESRHLAGAAPVDLAKDRFAPRGGGGPTWLLDERPARIRPICTSPPSPREAEELTTRPRAHARCAREDRLRRGAGPWSLATHSGIRRSTHSGTPDVGCGRASTARVVRAPTAASPWRPTSDGPLCRC